MLRGELFMGNNKKNDNSDNDLFVLLNQADSNSTVRYERTEFGKHIDHVTAFYSVLDEDQRSAFMHPAHNDESLRPFEATLNQSLLDRWNDLKEEADKIGGSYDPRQDDLNDVDFAVAGLRTMMDEYPSSDPVTKAIQDNTIEELGGLDAVDDLMQSSMNPDIGVNGLDPIIQKKLLGLQGSTYSYIVARNELGEWEVVNAFRDGKPIEVVGTTGGGIDFKDTPAPEEPSNAPVPQSPEITIDTPKPDGGW